ncbi:hypothetical protein [Haloparvum sp. PAK95]|uniref:hypothetical protein n=1 Tax=Haloparvum sp. PAK95 TaxID=3418962 RepID=UPI003D2F0451
MNSGRESESLVSFEVDGSTLSVRDKFGGGIQQFEADPPLVLDPALEELFHFPVDRAVSFDGAEFNIGQHDSVLLRDETGEVTFEAAEESRTSPPGTHYLEISGSVKAYVRIPDAAVTLEYVGTMYESPVRVKLSAERTITVGARSTHSLPAATITVPDDPAARMEAFSYLGSSIKEFSPERSWPTLRGHPPRILRGEALEIPSVLSKPDTGIVVTVPETHADLYRVAPLAFYFGASIEPGTEPALHLPNGYSESLTTPDRTLEESVERIISACFLLDTLARQDGYVPIPTREYGLVAPHLSFYPESLASEPLGDQLMEQLEAPMQPVLDALPRWPVTAVLRPDPSDVTLVPYLLDSMAHISVAEPGTVSSPVTVRDRPTKPFAVGYSHSTVPSGGVALDDRAFERELNETLPVVDEAVVAVVTDDADRAELLRSHLEYAPLRAYPERIAVHADPTTDELEGLFESGADLVVLDLSATGSTVACADGPLELSTLSECRPNVVVLDADRTGESSVASVVDAGATVSLEAPGVTSPDPGLRIVGCLLRGNSVARTAELLFDPSEYRIAGVPTEMAVLWDTGQNGECYVIDTVAPGEHAAEFVVTPSKPLGIGSVHWLRQDFSPDEHQLVGTSIEMAEHLSTAQVVDLLADEDVVVVLNGEVYADALPPTRDLVERSAARALRSDSGDEPTDTELNERVSE